MQKFLVSSSMEYPTTPTHIDIEYEFWLCMYVYTSLKALHSPASSTREEVLQNGGPSPGQEAAHSIQKKVPSHSLCIQRVEAHFSVKNV
jgi:hypothetical protein